jgi:hypothetical protein
MRRTLSKNAASCGFCDAAFFDKVLLIVDGRYWCGYCHAVFFDNVLLIVDGRYWCGFCDAVFFRCITETTPIPTIYDEENLIKECCITETTPIPTIYSVMQYSLIRLSSS